MSGRRRIRPPLSELRTLAATMTVSAIARRYDVARGTVHKWLFGYGLQALPEKPLPIAPQHRGEKVKPVTTARKCLKCRQPFPSAHVGNRLCRQCNERASDAAPMAMGVSW